MTPETEGRMRELSDEYGDPWVDSNGTLEELRKVFDRMPSLPSSSSSSSSVTTSPFSAWQRVVGEGGWTEQEEEEILTGLNLFWGKKMVFYLDRYADCGSLEGEDGREEGRLRKALPFTTLDTAVFLLQLHGGVIASVLHPGVSHIVVDRRERSRFPLLLARKRELRRHPWNACEKRVVALEWVEESVAAGRMLGFEGEGGWYSGEAEGGGRRNLVSDQELVGEAEKARDEAAEAEGEKRMEFDVVERN